MIINLSSSERGGGGGKVQVSEEPVGRRLRRADLFLLEGTTETVMPLKDTRTWAGGRVHQYFSSRTPDIDNMMTILREISISRI